VAATYAWPRVAAPLVTFATAGGSTHPLGGRGRGPWRRAAAHQLRSTAYGISHHALHRAFTVGRRLRDLKP
jgi:hypothetical protein